MYRDARLDKDRVLFQEWYHAIRAREFARHTACQELDIEMLGIT
jgi:hypothetical protein